ncbi:hypothetical protein KFK09_004803 [Dendrobium nobile]|uniref:Uncharacterized protein n=1 Tax=Dendrobium nobile TaxID=94219 RepID=A0A8T3BTZ1_DENNO|nr:hypothetical protein KFK09_004803 [Dendrobium nobile]
MRERQRAVLKKKRDRERWEALIFTKMGGVVLLCELRAWVGSFILCESIEDGAGAVL